MAIPTIIPDAGGKRISLLDWKASNVRFSVLLGMSVFVLLGALAYFAALVIDPELTYLFIGIALVVGGVQNIVAYWFSDKIALNVSGAREVTLQENRYLVNITEAVAIGAGVPAPKLYVLDSSAPNAFATGRNPAHGVIVVSTGLIELLDRQELEGVVAHEMAHIKNYDILFMSMIAATVGALVILRDVIWHSLRYGGRGGRDRDNGGSQAQAIGAVILVVLMILAPILATLLHLAVSRRREYLADATGAYITRNPEGLARALEKLRNYQGKPLAVSEGLHHMFFTHPKAQLNAANAFATHPPLEERIKRLRSM